MSTRTAIIASVTWIVLVVGVTFGLLWRAWENASPRERRDFEARATTAGRGAGTLAAIGCGAIWIPWALKRRRERSTTD